MSSGHTSVKYSAILVYLILVIGVFTNQDPVQLYRVYFELVYLFK